MEKSELPVETSFDEKFAGQIYIFQGIIEDANNHASRPGPDSFWVDISLKRCKNMLQLLGKDTFQPYSSDTKMKQLVKAFEETINKLENTRQELISVNVDKESAKS